MQAKRQRRWAMIGPELVGKSRTAWYFIRRFVNARRAKVATGVPMPVVVYEQRVSIGTWQFTPDRPNDADTTYSGWLRRAKLFDTHSGMDSLQHAANLLIVDCGSEYQTRPPLSGQATTVLVCPGDPQHHGVSSEFVGTIRRMEAASVDALVAAAPYMVRSPETFTEDVVRMEAAEVGAIPRKAFGDIAFDMDTAPYRCRRVPHLKWVDGSLQLGTPYRGGYVYN